MIDPHVMLNEAVQRLGDQNVFMPNAMMNACGVACRVEWNNRHPLPFAEESFIPPFEGAKGTLVFGVPSSPKQLYDMNPDRFVAFGQYTPVDVLMDQACSLMVPQPGWRLLWSPAYNEELVTGEGNSEHVIQKLAARGYCPASAAVALQAGIAMFGRKQRLGGGQYAALGDFAFVRGLFKRTFMLADEERLVFATSEKCEPGPLLESIPIYLP